MTAPQVRRTAQNATILILAVALFLLFLLIEAVAHVPTAQQRLPHLGGFVTAKDHESWISAFVVLLFFLLTASVVLARRREGQEDARLIEAGAEWRRTFDAVPDCISLIDTNYTVLRINKSMAVALGIAVEEAAGQPCYRLVHGIESPLINCPHRKMMESGLEETAEIHEERLGGDLLVTASPLRNESGRLTGCVHTARDISRLKNPHVALKERERQLAESQRMAHIGSWELTLSDMRFNCSDELCRIFKSEEHNCQPSHEALLKAIHPEDRERFRAAGRACLEEQCPYNIEYRIVCPDGTVSVIQAYGEVECDQNGNPVLLRGTAQDISALRTAEQAVLQKEKKLRAIASSLDEGIYVLDSEGKLTFMNPAAERLLGWKEAELLDRQVHEIIHPHDREGVRIPRDACPIFSVVRTGQCYASETEVFTRKDGTPFPIAVRSSPLTEQGLVVGCVSAFSDISERRRLEKDRERLVEDLRLALANIKTLRGILPICAHCKKIRDDQGYWNQVESYVRDHSEAQFSHGLCPDCARELYPDFRKPAGTAE